MNIQIFDRLESGVRSYCRDFPKLFVRAQDHWMEDESGRRYIDFLSGAGALNYGHNNSRLKERVIDYLRSDGIVHSLDLHTAAKRAFLTEFSEKILVPRQLNYRIQFTGPTGTNAVEAGMKIARKVTGRQNIVAFTNAFHGMSLGSLAATGARGKRQGAGLLLSGITRVPYDGYLGPHVDTITYIEKLLADHGSGVDLPAAFIVETIQAEGGLNVARDSWLRGLSEVATSYGALLIVDEIQTGCGRTGPFFSFEQSGIVPDVICVSKSIGGYGLPMAIVLLKPEHDKWSPGEHNGTFRGNNLAFVAGAAALEHYWSDERFETDIRNKGAQLRERLTEMARGSRAGNELSVRGRGLLQGLASTKPGLAARVSALAFERGLIVETCGPNAEVVKCLPPLTIQDEALHEGLDILESCVCDAIATSLVMEPKAPEPALETVR
jgi:diaminobutyrate-2-oxoglutarate transaminase